MSTSACGFGIALASEPIPQTKCFQTAGYPALTPRGRVVPREGRVEIVSRPVFGEVLDPEVVLKLPGRSEDSEARRKAVWANFDTRTQTIASGDHWWSSSASEQPGIAGAGRRNKQIALIVNGRLQAPRYRAFTPPATDGSLPAGERCGMIDPAEGRGRQNACVAH